MADDIETEIDTESVDENTSDDWISSGSDYSPKAEFKMAILAMEAVKACIVARATEMKQGFWNNRIDKQGNAIRVWMPDQRKIFINSVIALQNLLSAECHDDEIYNKFFNGDEKKEKVVSMKDKLDNVFKKYAYSMFEFDSTTGGWKRTNQMFMPQIDEELLVPSPQEPRVLINVKGGWDFKVNAYYDELLPLYDEIFKELRNVIFRIKDFKKKVSFG